MGAKADAYEALVNEEARCLERAAGHPVSHGSGGTCPTCGHAGLYDLKGPGLSPASIYFSVADERWRCMVCDMAFTGY
jgi:hypothetical protein